MARFKPGDPKPKNSGRKRGVRNKKTVKTRARLGDVLAKQGVNVEEEIAKAIRNGDKDMLKALQGLLPYLQPRIAVETPAPKIETPEKQEEPTSAADNLSIIRGAAKQA